MTLNEPQCTVALGHQTGAHAPALKLSPPEQLRVMHHLLMAHGRAVQMLRSACKSKPTIGWAPVGEVAYPHSHSQEDLEAAQRKAMSSGRSFWTNTMFSDPVCLGHYPEDGLRAWGSDMPAVSSADLETIHQPLDFYGLNIYQGRPVRAAADGSPVEVPRPPGYPITAMPWPIEPLSLYWGPRFIYERYKLPVYITENGMAGIDWVATDGKVHDDHRIDFTKRYLRELRRAIEDGIDVRGYFHWSIMDNFEWAEGYTKRFGLIHVDYTNQKRTPKESTWWYQRVIATNGAALDE
jgi:beta-glucosidase